MNQKTQIILHHLNQLYPNPPIPLFHTSNYTLLIAVVLSAQCTDVRVNQVTPRLFQLADTPEKMASLPLNLIQELIRPCGLTSFKAHAIQQLSILLVERFGSRIPNTFEELESLPGVGHKTASVIMSQCFQIPAFPVDTHIHRLAKRWGLSSGKNVLQTEKDLKKRFPKKLWNILHLQMIYYARGFCPARGHKKENCPICSVLT